MISHRACHHRAFIVMPDYGTRCTTMVLIDNAGNWHFTERRFDPSGQKAGESRFSFTT